MTIRAGVIGHPIGHSLSPAIHRAWLYAAGIDGSYEPILSPLDEFPETVADLRGHGLVGLNVTIPFKEQALALADQASERAKLAGAANLLRFEHGEIIADNTDGAGLLLALAGQAPSFSPDQAVVTLLGAGGAARGAAAALLTAGAGEIRLVNRTASKSEDLAHELGGLVRAFTWDEIDEALAGAGLLINATSLGLAGGLPLDLDLTPLPAESPVMDMVYRPLETPLLAQARASGRPAVDGLAMLIGQAAPSFEAFYGAPPPGIDIRKVALGGDAVIVLGLTGSIGMGKSTTSQMFQDEGVPVYDADAEVHRLYAKGGAAVPVVEAAFPGVTRDGAVDRAALSAKVVGDEPSMRLLEEIVHPLVGESRAGFFEQARRAGADLVVLDIPLLFETGGDGRVDKVVVVAPADIQRARVLERSGMTPAKFEAILARQVPDADKRARADFIVDTSAGMDAARAQVRQVIAALRAP